jgi:hypothetical protein
MQGSGLFLESIDLINALSLIVFFIDLTRCFQLECWATKRLPRYFRKASIWLAQNVDVSFSVKRLLLYCRKVKILCLNVFTFVIFWSVLFSPCSKSEYILYPISSMIMSLSFVGKTELSGALFLLQRLVSIVMLSELCCHWYIHLSVANQQRSRSWKRGRRRGDVVANGVS